jgi:hypothetical protein
MKSDDTNAERIRSISLDRLEVSKQIRQLELKAAELDAKLVESGVKLSELAYN